MSSDDSAPDPNRWRALAVCLVGGFMVLLDVSIVNVALPSIRTGLGADQSELQWVLSGYALTFGLLLVPAGRVGDLRGRRTVFVIALGLFTLASAVCGAAPNALVLVFARLAQGLAGGTLTPQISALIQELFQGKERAKAFGLFGSVVGISTAIGPLLGGALIELFGTEHGWRAVFFVNIPVGLVAMPIAWRILPRPSADRERRRHDLDLVGVVLLGLGAVVLLLPFVQEQTWKGQTKWLLVPAAALLLAAFVLWDLRYKKRGKEPLVDLELFKLRSYSVGVGLISLYFAGFTPLFFVFTLYLQTGQQYSALLAGLAIVPFAAGSGVAAAIGGRWVNRLGRKVVVLGLVLVVAGFVGAFYASRLYPDDGTGLATLAPLLVAGFGNGFVISPNQTLTLADVPVRYAGTAGGLLQTGQRIGSAVGIAAAGSTFFAHLVSSRGDYAASFRIGLLVALLFVVAALLVALADLVTGRRTEHTQHTHHGEHRLADADDDAYRPVEIEALGS
ncbi:drug resistance transporter, EmrB/QacA subfamily [Jatrophihabitans endophyticus]|uniref:Drug resistance transporter, EmrB/QacA subfamily n=1 Tax=Jatrophihabitans endophyticus TaxID=1206085 RepID=A0A1M5ERL6_9ACTN|nr:MFS transporter [Jatrophihabitans endophyticus]SHF81905.1 drug resistance transporter, EmrB/QacA subfamily [Jatrophihabitans endophyticus]